jgi:hypothetical protein
MGRSRDFDVRVFVSGCVTCALGVLLLLDQLSVLHLTFAYFAPAATAAVGVILLVHGLEGARRD